MPASRQRGIIVLFRTFPLRLADGEGITLSQWL